MALDALKQIVGEGGYLESPADTEPHRASWRGGWKGESPLVLFPKTTQHVADIVKHCAAEGIAIVPQGGNTGLVAGGIPRSEGGDVVVNLSRMNQLRELDAQGYTLTAEAGCILQTLQEKAAEAHRVFPLSMASEGSCELGGIISTNAGGTAVLHYGSMRAQVLGLEVVLPDGSVWHGLRKLHKDNTGYDMKQCFIGAEGTLGIITAATVKLYPEPREKVTAWLAVENMEVAQGLLAQFRAGLGDVITAFEVVSDECLQLVLEHVEGARAPLQGSYAYHLLVEAAISLPNVELRPAMENVLAEAMEQGKVADALIAESMQQAQALWHIREHISEAARKAGKGVHFDIAVPLADMARFVDEASPPILEQFPDIRILCFGHLGDGNVHFNLCLPASLTAEEIQTRKPALEKIVYAAVGALQGSFSAEHGIGQERMHLLDVYKSKEEMALMRAVKNALDPKNIMNPGKVV